MPNNIPPPQHFTGPDKQKFLEPNPQVQKILYARLESLSPDGAQTFIHSVTTDNIQVLTTVFPELDQILQRASQISEQGGQQCGNTCDQEQQGQDCQGQSCSPAFSMSPAKGGAPPQQGPAGSPPTPSFGFSRGGLVSIGMPKNAGMKTHIGEVNKGIPSNSLSRGGTVMPPPHPMGLGITTPASNKFASRGINNPGKYACGGSVQPQGQGAAQQMSAGPTGDPDTDQAISNQKVAESIVPQDGKSDSIDAKVSKGEFVMDNATVQYFGIGKLITMQEKAHEEISKHLMKQDAQQKDKGGDGGQQPPAAQPKGLAAQPQQQAPQTPGGGPPIQPSPPMQPPSGNTPNATQQRIQQTNTPRPHNPLSLAG